VVADDINASTGLSLIRIKSFNKDRAKSRLIRTMGDKAKQAPACFEKCAGPTKIKSPPFDGSFSFGRLLQMCFGQLHQPFSHNAQKPQKAL